MRLTTTGIRGVGNHWSELHADSRGSGEYNPRRDVTLIVITVIVFGTLTVGVMGFGATPVLDDDEGGTVFPIQDWNDDGVDEVDLVVEADRTTIDPGEAIEFTVTYENGTAATDARLRVDGEEYALDEDGSVSVTFERGGEFTATADREDTETVRYVADGLIVAVDRFDAELALTADEEEITAGENATFSLTRADTDEPVSGSVEVEDETYDVDGDGRVAVPFERAGTFEATASKSPTDTESFVEATTTVTVERREVSLAVSRDIGDPRPGDTVTVRVFRTDTNENVHATVEIDGEPRTADNGTLAIRSDRATQFDLSVDAPDTDSETFDGIRTTVTFGRYEAPIVLSADATTVERGETVTFNAIRNDTGDPVPGTLTAGDQVQWLDRQGTASVTFEESGIVPVTATRADTTTHTFPSDQVTVTVLDTDYEITSLDAPESVEQGAETNLSATVHNAGADAGTVEVTYRFDGEDRATETVSIAGNERETVTFAVPTDADVGEYDHGVSTRDDERSTAIEIVEPSDNTDADDGDPPDESG